MLTSSILNSYQQQQIMAVRDDDDMYGRVRDAAVR
jgi:hypothetical protein